MEADYRRLKADWLAGRRDREDALQLLFKAWMHWADPPFVTGFKDDDQALAVWMAVFDHFGGEEADDAEFLHVGGLMAGLFPWALGDEQTWLDRAERMTARSRVLAPAGFPPGMFEGRGDYGDYFANQARAVR